MWVESWVYHDFNKSDRWNYISFDDFGKNIDEKKKSLMM